MGLLTITGTIDLTQFWPTGTSDADTVKLKLTGANPFVFQKRPGGPRIRTHVFDGASVFVQKQGRKKVIDPKGQVTIRLQGVDAPELHYRPPSGGHNLRQHLGASATAALHDNFLQGRGRNPLPCRITSQVNFPNDVCDIYARVVGDVVLGRDGNANHWLLAEGWALPSFYSSMTGDEIDTLTKLSEAARKARKNVWATNRYTSTIGSLDRTLTTVGATVPDGGRLIIPKFFRRLYQWQKALDDGKTTAASLKEFLDEPPPSKRDKYHLTSEFVSQSASAAPVHDLSTAISASNRVVHAPAAMVFRESASMLLDSAGVPVADW